MSIEAMKLALEYLESEVPFYECEGNAPPAGLIETITTLRAAIEQAEKQEPAAWFVYIPSQQCGEYFDSEDDCELVDWMTNYPDAELTKLYTTPPQREQVQFPTMLRKMWSGYEVQAWLDENVNKEKNT